MTISTNSIELSILAQDQQNINIMKTDTEEQMDSSSDEIKHISSPLTGNRNTSAFDGLSFGRIYEVYKAIFIPATSGNFVNIMQPLLKLITFKLMF